LSFGKESISAAAISICPPRSNAFVAPIVSLIDRKQDAAPTASPCARRRDACEPRISRIAGEAFDSFETGAGNDFARGFGLRETACVSVAVVSKLAPRAFAASAFIFPATRSGGSGESDASEDPLRETPRGDRGAIFPAIPGFVPETSSSPKSTEALFFRDRAGAPGTSSCDECNAEGETWCLS
jgi:hypothetical protein